MKAIGIDIGTTTLAAVAVDGETGALLEARNVPNGADIAPGIQDAEQICQKALALIEALEEKYHPDVIGLDGQMHGIVYTDVRGNAVSPLYTWQNGMGDEPAGEGETHAQRLSRLTGYKAATGFGTTTHYVLAGQGRVPAEAAKFCAIHDYIGMRLTGRAAPLTHVSDAASFGLFDLDAARFDGGAIERAGLDAALFPQVTDETALLGRTARGVPVGCAIGDNQASFFGSVTGPGAAAVNVGTSGQINMWGDVEGEGFERRPLGGGALFLTGASLCGGRAYALLENFLRSCARVAGVEAAPGSLYGAMNALAEEALGFPDKLVFSPLFCGTRQQPHVRAAMTGAQPQNFDAAHLCGAFVEGMAGELYEMYEKMRDAGAPKPGLLVGSGNAIRKNPALKKAFEQAFGMPMRIPQHKEEAAYGAALFGLAAVCGQPPLALAGRCVHYEP